MWPVSTGDEPVHLRDLRQRREARRVTTRNIATVMKNDRYFKFLVVTIVAAIVLALVQTGQGKPAQPEAHTLPGPYSANQPPAKQP